MSSYSYFRRLSLGAVIALAGVVQPDPASAFCGFYVAKADGALYNKASRVVVARDGERTVISMASDYRGDPSEFAMVVPVPHVLQKEQIHVGDPKDFDHIDAYSAPRLVEYFDDNPCAHPEMMMKAGISAPRAMMDSAAGGSTPPAAYGVKVEAKYTVGEYDIMVLAADDSGGLTKWLGKEGYKIPQKAEPVIASYLKQGMHFFVAKVNLEKHEQKSSEYLRPLQMAFESPKFMLPLRLGTANADGMQDLIIYMLTKTARVEPLNYRTVRMPTEINLPMFVKDGFGSVYKDIFETTAKKEDYRAVFLEYAWNMSWCDPCAADPMSPAELRRLGTFWVKKPEPQPDQPVAPDASGKMAAMPIMPPPGLQDPVFITRMHVRYDGERFPEDLRFQETTDQNTFQARYILRHPWTGRDSCPQADVYRKELSARLDEEGQNLARLTGQSLTPIRDKLKVTFPDEYKGPAAVKPWYIELWDDATDAK